MARIGGKRERRPFRMEFGGDGRVSSFSVEEKGDCCTGCAGSDQIMVVTDASPNARHLVGRHEARSPLTRASESGDVVTDGAGFAIGVLVRDVC